MSDDNLILIRGRGSVSALELRGNFTASSPQPAFASRQTGTRTLPVGSVPAGVEEAISSLRHAHAPYRQLDRTVLLGLLAARQATAQAGWAAQDASLGVSIGSSRGATGRLEQFHADFLADGVVAAAASPLTTLGNVASWVAYDAGAVGGAALSHSSTCSSAFQALGNAVAWLRAGLADRFLAGGAEAPLTDFTLAQMHALGIYSTFAPQDWPCRPGAGAPSTFVLGEGAAVFALERVSRATLAAEQATASALQFRLESVGFGFEAIPSKTGLSPDGQHFQTAMRQALQQANCPPDAVDALVLHSPGTPAGDAAERRAVAAVFGTEEAPQLVSNKWLVGHTLGASAALSLEFALQILTHQTWPAPPFGTYLAPAPTRPIGRVLVNAAGFGGNASSALVSLV
ncbi:beta-ketoacyl synthase [Hymenobacter qilianensis]|uniref:Beta-ketoacyl synthase n=2 Tax=Hymenobacter qilianensis TaxID=1385715 RepID=A0ACB5PS49_9BACT|nr:beta-ketoacyl synthase N-terminal-like domain-containing protein [Hymenobacter qilianensis]QNP52321.1 beta-ketoacyl-ACP reductase [Hymenobacter qilianensis]GGF66517.1 beta-ketoacyl synthase [Hymenobacter qilianensis]